MNTLSPEDLKAAIDKWGAEHELRILQEECAEVIQAVSHYCRHKPNADIDLLEELADLAVTFQMALVILGQKEIYENFLNHKIMNLKLKIAGKWESGDNYE